MKINEYPDELEIPATDTKVIGRVGLITKEIPLTQASVTAAARAGGIDAIIAAVQAEVAAEATARTNADAALAALIPPEASVADTGALTGNDAMSPQNIGAALAAPANNLHASLRRVSGSLNIRDWSGWNPADHAASINAFLAHVAANDVGEAVIDGMFTLLAPIVCTPVTPCKTKRFRGDPTFQCGAAFHTAVTLSNFEHVDWRGQKSVIGASQDAVVLPNFTYNYSLRVNFVGVTISKAINSYWGRWAIRGFKDHAYVIDGTAVGMEGAKPDLVEAIACGANSTDVSSYGLDATFSGASFDANAFLTFQQATLTGVSAIPAVGVDETSIFCVITNGANQSIHVVRAIDRGANSINVSPWTVNKVTSGSIRYFHGAAVKTVGGDTAAGLPKRISVLNGGLGLLHASLYGGLLPEFDAQFVGIALVHGNDIQGGPRQMTISSAYAEGCVIDYLQVIQNGFGMTVTGDILNRNKIKALYGRDNSGVEAYLQAADTMKGTRITIAGEELGTERYAPPLQRYDGPVQVIVGVRRLSPYVIQNNAAIVNLSFDEVGHYLTGESTAQVNVVSFSASAGPTGDLTFVAPAGKTVNNGATAVFSSMGNGAVFAVTYSTYSLNFSVRRLD